MAWTSRRGQHFIPHCATAVWFIQELTFADGDCLNMGLTVIAIVDRFCALVEQQLVQRRELGEALFLLSAKQKCHGRTLVHNVWHC